MDDVSSQERQRILDRWVRDNNSGTASVDLTPAQQAWLSKHREIPIGVDGNWPPIDFTDEQGRHVGITADYLRLLGQRLGVRFMPKASATFKEMLAKVTRGELKIGATVAYSTQRARGLVYTTPFFNVREVIVTRDDNKHLQRAEDLAGHTVAMEDGYITVTKIKRRYPGIRLLLVKDTLSALQKVSWGQADAYIGNQAVATWLQRVNQLDNLVIAGDAGIGDDPQHFVVSRQAPDWAPLVGIMDKALASLSEEERQRISQRWLGARNITTTLPKVRLSKQEQRWLQEHKSIRLGVDRAWPPMEFIDEQGEYKGISRDYTRLFGRQLGINWVAPKALPWDDVLDGVKQKNLDVTPLLSHTPERETYLNFTKPYINAKVVIFNRRGESNIDSLKQLEGRHVAVVTGYSVTSDLQRDYPRILRDPYPSVSEALHAVSEGRSEAFVGILAVAGYLIGKEGLRNLQVAGSTEYATSFAMAVRKDWPELVNIVNKAIDTLDDETRNRIFRRWTTVEFNKQADYTLALQVLGGALLLLFIGSIWLG